MKHVYGFGYSQTGGDLYDYINAIHPLDVARNGHPIYDGYIVAVAGGNFVGIVPINQCEPPPGVGDPRLQFSNVGVPIIHVMSQSDYLFGIDARRARQRRARRPLPPLRDGRRRARDARRAATSPRHRRTSSRPASPCRR